MNYANKLKRKVDLQLASSIIEVLSVDNFGILVDLVLDYKQTEPITEDLYYDIIDVLRDETVISENKMARKIDYWIDYEMDCSYLDDTYTKDYYVNVVINFLNDVIKLDTSS